METKERRPSEGQRTSRQRPPAQRSSPQRARTQRTAEQRQPAQRQPGQRQPTQRQGTQTRTTGSTATRRRPTGQTETARRRPAPTRRRPAQPKPSPDVVYVQPTPFNRTRFILCLLIVVAVVLAVIFGMSLFFKVDADKITVSGMEKYTAWQIREASGIRDGENLLSISEPRISTNIQDALPYVNKVRVGIKLPDTVKIEIEELDVVYSAEATDGSWWLVRSDGYIVEKTNSADAEQYTKLLGIQLKEPAQGQQAAANQPIKEGEEGETVPATVLASEQLSTALSIAQYLEDCGVIGLAKSIDVTSMGNLELWYGERYQVTLGNSLELSRKIRSMKAAIDQMGDYQSGVLDVSFTTWPNEVGYTPFS